MQVRADGRIPSTFELETSAQIAQQIEDTLQAGGERLSFINDMNIIHDGIDIIIGSQHIGMLICKGIVAQLGGRYTTHPKLVGEKNGRQLYRITYSMRLPRFQKHDVILSKNRYYEIERIESQNVRVFDLRDGNGQVGPAGRRGADHRECPERGVCPRGICRHGDRGHSRPGLLQDSGTPQTRVAGRCRPAIT